MVSDSLFEAVSDSNGSAYFVRQYIRAQKGDRYVDWDTPNEGINNDWTPLLLAVYRDYRRVMRELLSHKTPGPNVAAFSKRSIQRPLLMAVRRNRIRCAQMLLVAYPEYQHVDMQDRQFGETALVKATRLRNWTMARVITGYNPAMDILNNTSNGALHYAIQYNQMDLVRRILSGRNGRIAARQKNIHGDPPLHLAVLTLIPLIVREVLDGGARKSDTDVWGEFAEQLALNINQIGIMMMIQNY